MVSYVYDLASRFHGADAGSNPAGDAIFPMCGQDLCVTHTDMFMKYKPVAQRAIKDFLGPRPMLSKSDTQTGTLGI